MFGLPSNGCYAAEPSINNDLTNDFTLFFFYTYFPAQHIHRCMSMYRIVLFYSIVTAVSSTYAEDVYKLCSFNFEKWRSSYLQVSYYLLY